jgi:hypothetical protein
MAVHRVNVLNVDIPQPPPWACAIAWQVAGFVSLAGAAFWFRIIWHLTRFLSHQNAPPKVVGVASINSQLAEAGGSIVLFTAMGIWMLRRGRRKWLSFARKKMGLCPKCGYDLRMSPGVCPECGWGGGARVELANQA